LRVVSVTENVTPTWTVAGGFVSELVAPSEIDRRMGEIADRIAGHAPITMRVTKEAIRRLLNAGLPAGDDLARACYGSKDFRIGIEAFVAKRPPEWTGE